MTDTFLTVEEAAKRLAVTPYTLREWLRAGKLRGVQVARRWRVPERALFELAAALARAGARLVRVGDRHLARCSHVQRARDAGTI